MAKKIPLTKGKFAIVDNEDFKKISQHKWHLSTQGYAFRCFRENGKMKNILMHRLINKTQKGKLTDHIDGDKLNNRRNNLRSCTNFENMRNRRMHKNCKSGIKGVSLTKIKSKGKIYLYWVAVVDTYVNGKIKRLAQKYFPYTEEGKLQAAKHYNEQAKIHFGEFARGNGI